MNVKGIDDFLIRLIRKDCTPSVQYIIFGKDKIIYKSQLGFADIKNQKKVTENTTYNAYSVTKTFTATSILQLAELKMLDVDEPVKQYLQEFPYSPEITIRQVMNHTAGIPNPIPLRWIHPAGEHKDFDRNDFFRHILIKNGKAKSGPNEKFAYSNLGYVILGQLIEKVSGIKYEDYIRRNILEPLQANPDELEFTITNTDQHAKGYHKSTGFSNLVLGFLIDRKKFMDSTEGKWQPFKDNYVNGASYGGLIGTSNAFVKYIQELLRPGCKIISDNYKRMLFTENHTRDNKPTGMCLAWFSGKLEGKTYFAHAGGGGGYYCEIRIYPGLEMGSVIMFNRTGIRDERFLDKTDKYFIG